MSAEAEPARSSQRSKRDSKKGSRRKRRNFKERGVSSLKCGNDITAWMCAQDLWTKNPSMTLASRFDGVVNTNSVWRSKEHGDNALTINASRKTEQVLETSIESRESYFLKTGATGTCGYEGEKIPPHPNT